MLKLKTKEKEIAKKFGALRIKVSNSTIEYHTSNVKKIIERNEKNSSQQRSCDYIVTISYLYTGYVKETKYFFDVYSKALILYNHYKDISTLKIINYQLN